MSRHAKLTFIVLLVFFFGSANAQLHADFLAPVPDACAPVTVQFTDVSTGNPDKWEWDFDNGDTSMQQHPSVVFNKGGIFHIKLIISNGSAKDSVIKTITVTGSSKAGFGYMYDNVCKAPSVVTFTPDNQQDTLNYRWDFGNGAHSAQPIGVTTFTTEKTYSVTLTTITPQGCRDSITKPFVVGDVKASFSGFSVVCKNAPATFSSTSDPLPLTVNWYVNGVSAGTGSNLTRSFAIAGDYTLKMVAGFGTCTQSAEKTVTVKEKPVPNFSESGSLQSCTFPVTIDFINKSSNANTYKWMFGDGNTSQETNIGYTYNKAGTYSVSLVAFNGDGCSDTLTKNGLVRLGPPVISGFASLPKGGCIPVSVTASANIQSPDPVASYDWNTGDAGQHLNSAAFSHTYENEGYYTVSLSVTTVNGCTGSYSMFQAVSAGTMPVPGFTADSLEACASSTIHFVDKTVGNVSSWNWHYGDGSTGSGKNPSHQYTKTGFSDVTLYVSNKGCNAPAYVIKNFINTKPPISSFTFAYNCSNQLNVQFTDHSNQPLAWDWDFGDGNHSNDANPSYSYNNSGEYQVILTTANDQCISKDTALITIVAEKPRIEVSPDKNFVCRNDTLHMTAAGSSDLIADYTWHTDDGKLILHDSSIQNAYSKSGDYHPYVIVKYTNQCTDTVYTDQPVHVYGPVAAFSTSQADDCLPSAVTFTDKSVSDLLHDIVSKVWSYGDGKSKEVNEDMHRYSYTTGGNFLPQLKITDAVGCSDSVMANDSIRTYGVMPGFNYTIDQSCDSALVTFNATAQLYNDEVATYSWNFGDIADNTSTLNTRYIRITTSGITR